MTWRQAGSKRLELVGRHKYEGVDGTGGIVYELSEVDHHRGSQAKAKYCDGGNDYRRVRGRDEKGGRQDQHSCIGLNPPFSNRTLLSLQ